MHPYEFQQEFMKFFSAEPFRFTPLDSRGNIMRRKLMYPADNEVSNMLIKHAHERTEIKISYPIISLKHLLSTGSQLKPDLRVIFNYTGINDVFAATGLQLRFDIYDTVRDCKYGEIAKTILNKNPYIITFFEIYNTYEDTPGTDADKTIAVGKYVGMSREEILKLKHRHGLLTKEDELSDKDTLDLF